MGHYEILFVGRIYYGTGSICRLLEAIRSGIALSAKIYRPAPAATLPEYVMAAEVSFIFRRRICVLGELNARNYLDWCFEKFNFTMKMCTRRVLVDPA
jgi:hypothetical protein